MNRDQKAAVVEELAGQIRAADAVFAVDYRGISVAQAADLRARLRESGTRFRIVKNSLTERAADEVGAVALKELLTGPTALAFVTGDAALAAKALSDAARALRTLEFKGGLMDWNALSAAEVQAIARLPSRDMLNAQLVGTIAAPLSGLVRGLNALIAGLAIQLQQMVEQGLVSGEAPAAEQGPVSGDARTAAAATERADAAEAAAESVPEETREDEPTAVATPEIQGLPEPEPAAEAGADAAPLEPIVDVEAEPGQSPPPGETDEDVAPDQEPGA
ncbi:MAG: 50S ribosomal protein L10, partial [Solirubrobacterales bacterium]|nr:50S ribosomal protein L10 [Solirubrobacterales bacterium]